MINDDNIKDESSEQLNDETPVEEVKAEEPAQVNGTFTREEAPVMDATPVFGAIGTPGAVPEAVTPTVAPSEQSGQGEASPVFNV